MLEAIAIALDGSVLSRHDVAGKRRFLVGRSRECDIVVPEPMVSRFHAEILCIDQDADRWVVRDLDSKHGLWANGCRVLEARITPGDTIKLGPARLRFADLGLRLGREIDRFLPDDPPLPDASTQHPAADDANPSTLPHDPSASATAAQPAIASHAAKPTAPPTPPRTNDPAADAARPADRPERASWLAAARAALRLRSVKPNDARQPQPQTQTHRRAG